MLGRERSTSMLAMPVLVASSKRALEGETAPKAFQVAPPSSEYCQTPLVLSTPVTAMPTGGVVFGVVLWYVARSGSLMLAGDRVVTKLLTVVPTIIAAV